MVIDYGSFLKINNKEILRFITSYEDEGRAMLFVFLFKDRTRGAIKINLISLLRKTTNKLKLAALYMCMSLCYIVIL